MTRHRWQTGGILLASALLLSACGSSSASGSYAVPEATKDAAYYADYDYDTVAEESYAGDYDGLAMNQTSNAGRETGSGLPEAEMNRKLVKTVNLDCETEDIDSFEAKLMQQVREAGGYVEASNRWGRISTEGSGRHGSYTLRIPVEQLDKLVSSIRGETNVLTQSSDVSDITLQYVDTESRIKALRIEQEQLLGMLEKAESVEDMITIQSRLSEVNASLQNYESSRKLMDNQVNYATIYLNIDEVVKYTPVEEKGALTTSVTR